MRVRPEPVVRGPIRRAPSLGFLAGAYHLNIEMRSGPLELDAPPSVNHSARSDPESQNSPAPVQAMHANTLIARPSLSDFASAVNLREVRPSHHS